MENVALVSARGNQNFFNKLHIPNHWTRKYAKNGPQNAIFSCNFQAWTIQRIVCMKVGYRMLDSLSDYPTIKKSDYPLPVRALIIGKLNNMEMSYIYFRTFTYSIFAWLFVV